MSHAWEGYASSKGLKKQARALPVPTPEERAELHRRIREREEGMTHG